MPCYHSIMMMAGAGDYMFMWSSGEVCESVAYNRRHANTVYGTYPWHNRCQLAGDETLEPGPQCHQCSASKSAPLQDSRRYLVACANTYWSISCTFKVLCHSLLLASTLPHAPHHTVWKNYQYVEAVVACHGRSLHVYVVKWGSVSVSSI